MDAVACYTNLPCSGKFILWHSLILLLVFCKPSLLLSVPVSVSGARSVCSKATATITPVPMFMRDKEVDYIPPNDSAQLFQKTDSSKTYCNKQGGQATNVLALLVIRMKKVNFIRRSKKPIGNNFHRHYLKS